ncbi:FAM57A (predicted) [Pycnogonum litorale]
MNYIFRTTSTFHAVLCFTSGLIIIQNTIHAMKDSRYWLTETYAMIAWSYFTYDTFSMFHGYLLNNHEIKATITKKFLLFAESKGLLFIHHVFLAVGIISLLVSRREMGDFVAGCFYMMELSTPFLHARYLLIKLQMNKCRLYTVNGVFIFMTFFSCRILVFPVMYHIYGVQNNLPSIMATVTTIPYMCNVFILMCFIPQCYWFYIICKIMVLTFLKGNSYQKNSKKAN